MGRLQALKPRVLGTLPSKVRTAPTATPRLTGTAADKMREAVRLRDGYLCQACMDIGVYRAGHQVDHTIPLEEGGSNAMSNQRLLCKEHHDRKSGEEHRRRNLAAMPTSR